MNAADDLVKTIEGYLASDSASAAETLKAWRAIPELDKLINAVVERKAAEAAQPKPTATPEEIAAWHKRYPSADPPPPPSAAPQPKPPPVDPRMAELQRFWRRRGFADAGYSLESKSGEGWTRQFLPHPK